MRCAAASDCVTKISTLLSIRSQIQSSNWPTANGQGALEWCGKHGAAGVAEHGRGQRHTCEAWPPLLMWWPLLLPAEIETEIDTDASSSTTRWGGQRRPQIKGEQVWVRRPLAPGRPVEPAHRGRRSGGGFARGPALVPAGEAGGFLDPPGMPVAAANR